MWRCYPKVDLFESKKNILTKTYASVIHGRDPDNIGNALRLNWKNIRPCSLKVIYIIGKYSLSNIKNC
jgi:hypothetical protein